MVEHGTLVWFSKTFGLFYLLALSVIALAYAFWPSRKREFDQASVSILTDEDKPWRN